MLFSNCQLGNMKKKLLENLKIVLIYGKRYCPPNMVSSKETNLKPF